MICFGFFFFFCCKRRWSKDEEINLLAKKFAKIENARAERFLVLTNSFVLWFVCWRHHHRCLSSQYVITISLTNLVAIISTSAKGIGCFKDTGRRAINPLEGRSRLLRGNYRRRRYAIRKCALAAIRRGFRVFAIQNGGWCASTKTAHLTYRKYGTSNGCRNGKGGPWANDVYVLRGLWMF